MIELTILDLYIHQTHQLNEVNGKKKPLPKEKPIPFKVNPPPPITNKN